MLSDPQAHVMTTSSSPAVEHFQREYRKQITQGTMRGSFQLSNLEIIALYFGPAKTSITMSSTGSSTLGLINPLVLATLILLSA